jgi:hypothetical protein
LRPKAEKLTPLLEARTLGATSSANEIGYRLLQHGWNISQEA